MIKRNFIYLFCLALLVMAGCNNSPKKADGQQDSSANTSINSPEEIQQVSELISRFARAYLSQDNAKVNALIHPEHGIAVIYRPGVADTYTVEKSLDFKKPVPSYYAYETFQNDQVLSFAALPEYDCGTEKWSKTGFYCDSTANISYKPLETIAKFQDEFEEVKYDDIRKKEIEALEQGAYRVILAQTNGYLIFHVKKFDKGWFVTILDRAYAGCDA